MRCVNYSMLETGVEEYEVLPTGWLASLLWLVWPGKEKGEGGAGKLPGVKGGGGLDPRSGDGNICRVSSLGGLSMHHSNRGRGI